MLGNLQQIPLGVWLAAVAVMVLLTVVIMRSLDFEGVNLTATPPFFTFRFKRRTARTQPRPVSGDRTGLPASRDFSGTINAGGGTTLVAQGDHTQQVLTGGAPYIGTYVAPSSVLPLPKGSAPPPSRTAHYVQRGDVQNQVRDALVSQTSVAVVGVAGMGGIGKTELARFLANEFEGTHRVIWLEVNDRPLSILQGELGRALGITFSPNTTDQSRYEMLLAAFHNNPHIVFFDDVYKSAILHLKWLLPPAPPCAALITSRQRELGVARVVELDVMTPEQSLELVREAHGLGDAIAREPDAALKLCELCGYLPLALDITASRLRKQLHFSKTPIAAFNQTLTNRLKELQRGAKRDRLDSVTANIDLSYSTLSDDDRRRLRALAAFAPSGFLPRAAAAVWSQGEGDACASIEHLQDESLVMNAQGVGRFRLHDLVRDYAAQKLSESGERETASRLHAEFLVKLFDEHFTDDISNAPDVGDELDNLRVAANWARSKHEGHLLALLATKPRNWLYVYFVSAWDEWLGWLTDALRVANHYDGGLRANVLQAIGDVQQFRDERDAALKSYAQALELFRSVGARLGEANVLQAIGDVQQFRKENDAALQSYAQALTLFRSVGDRLGEANVLASEGKLYLISDPKRADELLG
ncbi:MAG: tetratricopeptide repeat protein [Chloroflexi bacterium]|nr:tetratricopeptide repeat protein [Chloroflexota bacterium]